MKFHLSGSILPLRRALVCLVAPFFVTATVRSESNQTGPASEPRWFEGNLHTDLLWSDGDNCPESIEFAPFSHF